MTVCELRPRLPGAAQLFCRVKAEFLALNLAQCKVAQAPVRLVAAIEGNDATGVIFQGELVCRSILASVCFSFSHPFHHSVLLKPCFPFSLPCSYVPVISIRWLVIIMFATGNHSRQVADVRILSLSATVLHFGTRWLCCG